MNTRDTIAAVATGTGSGGLSVIRVSGPLAVTVVDRVFRSPRGRLGVLSAIPERRSVLGGIWEGGRQVDEVLAIVFRGPRSFTGEDTVEVSGHGGGLVTRRVLEALLRAGARLAQPGEFTYRAFLNGRMDLSQAEAVADIIGAQTDRALAVAQEQLRGRLSEWISQLREDLLEALAHIEAHIDFPDEDIEPASVQILCDRIGSVHTRVSRLLATSDEGRILREGLRIAIVGAPNAGKSSLLNRLLGTDRAIVSEIPGTTRDTIEEKASIRGLPLVLIDTAGLRETSDPVECEGIRRSRAAVTTADVILHVRDASTEVPEEDQQVVAAGLDAGRRIRVANKVDLGCHLRWDDEIRVSCRTGEGLETLLDRIEAIALGSGVREGDVGNVAISVRHRIALERGSEGLQRARLGLENGLGLELVAADLREALGGLEDVIGSTDVEDLLDRVFSRFCLGK